MVQKLVSTAVEESEDFFYLPKLYVGPDPQPTEPTERVYVVGNIQLAGNIIVPDGGTIGQAAGPLLTFDDTNNFLEITGCKVGIGTATPLGALHIEDATELYYNATDGNYQASYFQVHSNTAWHAPFFMGRRARGTAGTPLAIQQWDNIMLFQGRGHDGTAWSTDQRAGMTFQATENWDGSSQGARVVFHTTPNGSTTPAAVAYIDQSGNVGIGIGTPAARLHVDQVSTIAAIPVLALDQADVSEEMIEFISTIGVGNAIEAVDGKTLTTTHFIKVTIPGPLTRYFPVGTIA